MPPLPLSSEEAQKRLVQSGPNAISEEKPASALSVFAGQLKNPLINILVVAAIVTTAIGGYIDAAVILLAIILNSVLGFFQEFKAQKTLTALKNFITPKARVLRDNTSKLIPTAEIVPGDLVVLSPGDRIPADGIVVTAVNFFVNEAILTGESAAVSKTDRTDANTVFMGTVAQSGRATIQITQTGGNTALGKIAQTLAATHEPSTPLQTELTKLARNIAVIVVFISVMLFLIGILAGENFATMFTTVVAVAVSAVPEGMTISLTAILAIGMQRILKRKALVRKLVSAETLGSVTVICADKTGTLTEGRMKVSETAVTNLSEAVKVAVLANNLDDPIENALIEWAKANSQTGPDEITASLPRTQELPFDSRQKYMAVATGESLWVKGAPEILIARSSLPEDKKKEWEDKIEAFGKKGLRLIALAYKKIGTGNKIADEINNLEFLGVVGVMDPVRTGVLETVAEIKSAQIKLKVITGDYRVTAQTIVSAIGLEISDPGRQIMEGAELETITDDRLRDRVGEVILFCRVLPHHKLKIVKALQDRGEVVAMTGDGVNDALALKSAEIAIVVADAPDVARDSADIVLIDSNLRTITAAVEEGRAIFANIRKVVLYLLSDAFAEIILIIASIFLKLPLPLTASQILWINIISDGLPNMALAFEPGDPNAMKKPPRLKNAPVVTREMGIFMAIISLVKSLLAITAFTLVFTATGNLVQARTLTFVLLGTGSLFYIFAVRNLDRPVHKYRTHNYYLYLAVLAGFAIQLLPVYHPAVNPLFHTLPLPAISWVLVIACGILLLTIAEITKALMRKASWHEPS